MKTYLISDTHFNHGKIATYCDRPENFTELIVKNWSRIVQPTDLIIHLGDVGIGNGEQMRGNADIVKFLPGRKVLIRGNHDRKHSNSWWMTTGGFDFACDKMVFRDCLMTHEPYRGEFLPHGTMFNVHGHLHNIFHGFHPNASVNPDEQRDMYNRKSLRWEHQRLFAIEYTNYSPVEIEKFLNNPDKYNARGIK